METPNKGGTEHPISIIRNQAYEIFAGMGFEIVAGPELENEWYCFDALNMPKDHPSRDMQDTFWIKMSPDEIQKAQSAERSTRPVMRTQVTATTIRSLEKAQKEGRTSAAFISVGKVYRNEATDATHEAQFFQMDGSMIGENVTLAHLKGVLMAFYKKVLGEDSEVEIRPSFFPFVEPGIEIHAKFNGRWLEMGGGGMIHPTVLKNAGYDPEKIQGFAFGVGLDRIPIVKWGITDIRYLYQGDLRLNQF
ncbi:MAG: phenylalanine--tRNA ligase subunit alpha [bacterium]